MNDKFLTQFRKPPRPAFAHALYERISQEKVSPRAQLVGHLTLCNALAGLVTLILLAACVYGLTAPKWVEVDKRLWVQERSSGDIYINQMPPFSYTSLLSIEEVKTQAGFEFKVPTWIPPLLDLKGASVSAPGIGDWEMNPGYPLVNLFWARGGNPHTPEELAFQAFYPRILMVDKYYPAYFGMVVGWKSTKMTRVNNIPAVLIHGDWNYNAVFNSLSPIEIEWDKQAALQLLWIEGDVVYRIYAIDSSASADDLIRMAESAR